MSTKITHTIFFNYLHVFITGIKFIFVETRTFRLGLLTYVGMDFIIKLTIKTEGTMACLNE